MKPAAASYSPYTSIGPRLVDMGYSAIPVMPGSKRPGMYSHGQWYGENDWARFCERLPTKFETPIWASWPDAGVCIALDDTIKVVDIDSEDDAVIAAVIAILPATPVQKRGQKGRSLFFRGSAAIQSRPFNIQVAPGTKPGRAVDLLAKGRQTVLPPSVHPGTEKPYVWLEDALDQFEPDDLPELPDDIADRIAEALRPHGLTNEEVKRDFIGVESGDSVWREIKDMALANLDHWVPDLGLPMAAHRTGSKSYRAAAVWRGGDGFNVSFHADGIRDMAQDQGLTPIDVVMKARALSDMDALAWLKNKLGYVDPWVPTIDTTKLIERGLARNGVVVVREDDLPSAAEPAPEHDAETGEILAMPLHPPTGSPGTTSGLPAHLCVVPGLVGDIVDWLNRSARNPSPTLNLGAALAYVGALAGRRYEGPTGLRSNVYLVGMAPSGFGKEHPRAGVKSLAAASNTLGKFFGGNKIASSSALRNRVKKSPSLVYMIDEFGGFMRKVTSVKSGNHEKEIAEDLLEMTGTAASIFMGADYAQALAEPIHNPNVCIYGTSTPDAFWKALSSGSIADGFLPRFIMLDAGTVRPSPRDPEANVNRPPAALVDAVQGFVAHKNGGNLNGMLSDGSTSVSPIPAVWGDGAKRTFARFQDQMFRATDAAQPELEPIWARVAENSMRLALIVAAGCEPERPVVSESIMQWAADLALRSAEMLIAQAEERVADNDRQAEYKRVRALIARAGKRGTARSDVARLLKGVMDRRRMHDVIDQLVEAGEVTQARVALATNNRKVERLFARENAPVPTPEKEEEQA